MRLSPGTRLKSQVCTTEVIVVQVPEVLLELGCGGAPLIAADGEPPIAGTPAEGLDSPTLLGKRYTTAEPTSLELLAVKAGSGTLTADGQALVLKDAKPLPSSD